MEQGKKKTYAVKNPARRAAVTAVAAFGKVGAVRVTGKVAV